MSLACPVRQSRAGMSEQRNVGVFFGARHRVATFNSQNVSPSTVTFRRLWVMLGEYMLLIGFTPLNMTDNNAARLGHCNLLSRFAACGIFIEQGCIQT